jgi:transmembrane sensor
MVGNHRVTDIGTKFSILRVGDDAEIIVKEGRVRIDALGASRPQAPVFADGGSVVLARADETVVASKPVQVITDELDWRRGRLVFNQETLQDAAAEFNRYNETKIVVRGKAKDIRVGGSFKADNLESFAWLIREGFHVSVRKRGNEIIVSK